MKITRFLYQVIVTYVACCLMSSSAITSPPAESKSEMSRIEHARFIFKGNNPDNLPTTVAQSIVNILNESIQENNISRLYYERHFGIESPSIFKYNNIESTKSIFLSRLRSQLMDGKTNNQLAELTLSKFSPLQDIRNTLFMSTYLAPIDVTNCKCKMGVLIFSIESPFINNDGRYEATIHLIDVLFRY